LLAQFLTDAVAIKLGIITSKLPSRNRLAKCFFFTIGGCDDVITNHRKPGFQMRRMLASSSTPSFFFIGFHASKLITQRIWNVFLAKTFAAISSTDLFILTKL